MNRALLSLLLLCGTAVAQNVSVPPEVVTVLTVGRWQTGSTTGSYRVVVTREGWEHVWSRVFVEWRPDPKDREDSQETTSVAELVPPQIGQGTAVLEATAQQQKPGGIIVTVLATSNMELGAKKQRFVFSATAPGVVQLLQAPNSK